MSIEKFVYCRTDSFRCSIMDTILLEVSNEITIPIVYVEANTFNNYIKSLNFKCIPSIIFIKDDTEIFRLEGMVSKSTLKKSVYAKR